jgi:hypothetical protein
MKIFGLEIKRNKTEQQMQSVVGPDRDDGSTVITSAAGYYSYVVDLETALKSENEVIRRYREISYYPDCDSAIDDVVNEAIVFQENEKPINLNLDDIKISSSLKNKIRDEFENVLKLLKFNVKGHDIFRTWYIDGRIYYHILVDEKNPKNGIVELRYVDPRKIRKIKDVKKKKNEKGVDIVVGIDEYYVFNDKGIVDSNAQGIKLPLDSVVYAPSGQLDQNSGMVLSYLHKAIKVVNQLKMMEDSLVIYRISRAPERRVFYVDVGNLPKLKAEQYVNDLMNKFRNKIVYDASTGEVRDDRKHMSLMEDFWMPRREGGKGTEITTLPGGQSLGQIEDIQFFQNKLYQALNVPASRLKSDNAFNLGRSSEITRDEVKFSKFISRLRAKFNSLFLDLLRVQLILKGIISPDDWDDFSQNIRFDYMQDNHFSELKDNEIIQGRLNLLQSIDPFVGKYYTTDWVKKNILHQTDEEIAEMKDEIDEFQQSQLEAQQAAAGDSQNQQDQGAGPAPDQNSQTQPEWPGLGDK